MAEFFVEDKSSDHIEVMVTTLPEARQTGIVYGVRRLTATGQRVK